MFRSDAMSAMFSHAARAIKRRDRMNKLEADYAAHLESLRRNGEIAMWMYEPLKLNLAPGQACSYTPDFMVVSRDNVLELHEVKGFWEDDARVKIKVAADKFPFVFVAVSRRRKSDPWRYEFFTREVSDENRA